MKKKLSIIFALGLLFFSATLSSKVFADSTAYDWDNETVKVQFFEKDSEGVGNNPGSNGSLNNNGSGDNSLGSIIKDGILPQTGEGKTIWYSIFGVILIGLSILIIIFKRRSKKTEEEK